MNFSIVFSRSEKNILGILIEPRPSDMGRLLRTDTVPEEAEDAAATISATETLSEEEQEELRRELAKVEEEIQTLSQVLAAKEKHLAEIKRKLGINSLQELKQNIAKGWQDVTATSAYKKTSETLSQAGQKASAAFSSVGSVITKKLEDVKLQAFSHSFSIRSIQHSISMPAMRNSPTFKSFEEKVENLKITRIYIEKAHTKKELALASRDGNISRTLLLCSKNVYIS
uniref:Tumor protein D52 n=1 Tax=Oryctolagus cuniculus TaxID=9986 RepID=A0A5F9D328_RABIT